MQSLSIKELQGNKASNKEESLTNMLMERICEPSNIKQAMNRVCANKGAAGIDGMKVEELPNWINTHERDLIQSLLRGNYEPQEVRGVEIPKPDGGKRQLGIPTLVDRLVQQAIQQVLEPIIDPTFSNSSYGFRRGRNAHQAIKKAKEYIEEGREIVVDIDIEKYFDRVNHDVLMSRLELRIKDKRLLRTIRKFLEAGMMKNGVRIERMSGMPQGGNLSPLLSNILLDDLDKELEKRGHKFCRYADDCNIYVNSQVSGERVMCSIKKFLSKKLRLKVNEEKSKVEKVDERTFLGYGFRKGRIKVSSESIKRVKKVVRQITRRNRGREIGEIINQLNEKTIGWVNYFKLNEYESDFRDLESWIRRKLRCYILKQKKGKSWTIANFLKEHGVATWVAWNTAKSGKGEWRLSRSPAISHAMNNAWFDDLGFKRLTRVNM